MKKDWKPNRTSGFVRGVRRHMPGGCLTPEVWYWRQVFNFKGLYLVDHGGSLWIEGSDGYNWLPEVNSHESIFYDMDDIY